MLIDEIEDIVEEEETEGVNETEPCCSSHKPLPLRQQRHHYPYHHQHAHHYQHPGHAHAHTQACRHSRTKLERKIYGRIGSLTSGGGHSKHSLPHLTVVPPCSSSSSVERLPLKRKTLSHGDESMTMVVSAFYAKILIVLGIALPVTSTIQNEKKTTFTSDIFSLYLYIGSMAFLIYIFYHLRLGKQDLDKHRKRTRYGSFYLHMGVAGFSVGSIIYSCLQLGEYFDLSGDCQSAMVVAKPAFRILFTVAQTVFIFSYTDVLDPMRGVVIDRFGLMHMLATNICEWLNVVIQETRDDFYSIAYGHVLSSRYIGLPAPSIIDTDAASNVTDNTVDFAEVAAPFNISCNVSDMIIPLLKSANPYLRPCGVEYSLLCSIMVAVIWKDMCTVPGRKSNISEFGRMPARLPSSGRAKSAHHFSVDCASSHKGLFSGIALLAGTIVSLMLFSGLFQNPKHVDLALLQMNIWEALMFVAMAAGSAACLMRMRTLALRKIAIGLPLEHSLLLVTQCGVYLYYLFMIIGATFMIERYPDNRRATRIITPVCAIAQCSLQTLLVMDAWSRRCSPEQARRKPGRQLLTFLLIGNFALWLLNRVKNSRAEFHPLPMEFFGVWAWTLITHVSVPLLVCYRFQATVCIYEIWKYAYKPTKDIRREEDDIELKNHLA